MHSFDDQRLRYCDNGVAFLVNTADQSCKFSRARVDRRTSIASNFPGIKPCPLQKQAVCVVVVVVVVVKVVCMACDITINNSVSCRGYGPTRALENLQLS